METGRQNSWADGQKSAPIRYITIPNLGVLSDALRQLLAANGKWGAFQTVNNLVSNHIFGRCEKSETRRNRFSIRHCFSGPYELGVGCLCASRYILFTTAPIQGS